MKWHCWTCGQDFTVTPDHARPEHCPGATFTPYAERADPGERTPDPNVLGDHEAVVLWVCLAYGGIFGARASAPGRPATIAVWVPEGAAVDPLDVPRLAVMNALLTGMRTDPYYPTAAEYMRHVGCSWAEARRLAKEKLSRETEEGRRIRDLFLRRKP